MKRLIITLVLALSLMGSCYTKNNNRAEFSIARFESLTKNKLPLIQLDINGQRYDFLISTAANISLIDSTVCSDRKLTVKDSPSLGNIVTFGGICEKKKHVVLMNQNFYVHDIHKLVEEIKDYTGVKVDGVIGYDILEHNKSTIDFEKQLVSNINNN